MKSHALLPMLIIALALVAAALLPGCRLRPRPARPGTPSAATPRCPLDGEAADPQALTRRPLAVVIENSPAARPQTGLDQACVVYEAITEGGITRFLAIYLHEDPEVIGPVRSARPHFIRLAREYDALLVHCGESLEALRMFNDDPSIFHLNELEHHAPFQRDRKRRAPHNLYTSSAKLRAWMTAEKGNAAGRSPSPFAEAAGQMPDTATPAQVVDINFGGAIRYHLQFRYDEAAGGYHRYMDGKLHVDRHTGKPLVARNIILQHVWTEPYAESKVGTYLVNLDGGGAGHFIRDGKRVGARWRKPGEGQRTVFTDDLGQPLPFQRGQTWVEIIPLDGTVAFRAAEPAATESRTRR